MKNKFMLIMMLLVVIISISATHATDMSSSSEVESTLSDDTIVTDYTTTSNSNINDNNKEVTKTTNNIKTESQTLTASGYSDLVSKINTAKTASDEVVISLTPGNYNATGEITWGGSSNKKLTIEGNGLVLDGMNKYRFIQVQSGNKLTLKNITLQNFKTSARGGAILCLGQLIVEDSTFINNSVTSSSAGAILYQNFDPSITSTINNSKFIGNKDLSGTGGAISVQMAQVYINNTEFINNSAAGSTSYGGAIYNMGTLTIENSLFDSNNNSNIGGAIANDNIMNITNVTFVNNYASRFSGALNGGNSYLNITNCNFTNNSAGQKGGAINGNNKELKVESTLFDSNNAPEGGAIYINGKTNITSSNFTKNNATTAAAIYAQGNTVTLTGNIFSQNTAENETLFLPSTITNFENNQFIDTAVLIESFEITTPKTEYNNGDEITININMTLKNPEYYGNDITYQIFVNDENKYNTTENIYTFTGETGSYAVYATTPITDITSNTINLEVIPKKELVVTPITAFVGDVVDITAQLESDGAVMEDVSSGKVVFKVNGKTLKDDTGKIIYVKLVNGTATLPNYVIPENWTKENTIIQAVYTGSLGSIKSEEVNLSISNPVPTMKLDTTQTGDTLTLTVNITDGDKTINTGKVVFKINGKTVKDENGKVIYQKIVDNMASVEYVLPENYKSGNYTITATFISPSYDKLEESKIIEL